MDEFTQTKGMYRLGVEKHLGPSCKEFKRKISETGRGACFREEVITCILFDLATQRSLMIIARTALEECRARARLKCV